MRDVPQQKLRPDGLRATSGVVMKYRDGKLGPKHLELATAGDAFQESCGQPRVLVRPWPAVHGISGR